MKTLKLSTLVLLLVSVFASCTKDFQETNPTNAPDATGNEKGIASLPDFKVETSPSYLSSTVKVSGTIQFDKAVNMFNYTVQMSTEQDASGNWINFADTKYAAMVNLGSVGEKQDKHFVTATDFPFEFSFVPKDEGMAIGKTGWRLRINGGDALPKDLGDKTLELIADPVTCTGLTLKGVVEAPQADPNNEGMYIFTVKYTVDPCQLDVLKLKTQGGLTNGVTLLSASEDYQWVPGNSTNQILGWVEAKEDGSALDKKPITYTIQFSKAYSGTGTIDLTGQWSVSASLVGGGEEKVYCEKLTYPQL